MTVRICFDKDAACAEIPASMRCKGCSVVTYGGCPRCGKQSCVALDCAAAPAWDDESDPTGKWRAVEAMSSPCTLCNGRGFYGIPGGQCEFCKGTGRFMCRAAPPVTRKEPT